MPNRKRNIQLKICLTEEEKELFIKKMHMAKAKNMGTFIRKCVLEKEILVLDLSPFYKIQSLLSNATNNINQIAKHTNTTGIIYAKDIDEMKKMIVSISKNVIRILDYLQKYGKGK